MKRLVMLVTGCLVLGLSGAHGQTPKKSDLPKFMKNLTASDAKERIAAIDGIAKIGELKKIYAKDAIDPLCNMLRKDNDAGVRAAAATALARVDADPEKAVPALIEGLKDKDRNVIIASANAVGAMGKAAADAIPLLKEHNDKARADQTAAKAEQAKAKADGDKEKEKLARAKGQQAQQMAQAAGGALRAIAGK
jgi:HEAT repeat protein